MVVRMAVRWCRGGGAVLLTAGALALAGSAPAQAPQGARAAFLQGGKLVVLDLATRSQRVLLKHAGAGPVHWSGDGHLLCSCHPARFTAEGKAIGSYGLSALNPVHARVTAAGRVEVLGTE